MRANLYSKVTDIERIVEKVLVKDTNLSYGCLLSQ